MDIVYSQENSRLAAKYDFIVYPLDYGVLKKVLRTYAYKMPQVHGEAPPEAILTVDGLVGKKDEFTVDVSTERQIFGVSSTSSHKLEHEFNMLEDSISKEIGIELPSKARFYEFIYDAVVKTGSNPLEVMAKIGREIPIYNEISQLLGGQVSPLNLKVSPTNTSVESENWFDFTIEPVLNKATIAYHIGFVFRNKEKTRVLDKISNVNIVVEDSLKLIESR